MSNKFIDLLNKYGRSLGILLSSFLFVTGCYLFFTQSEKTLEFDQDLVLTIANTSEIAAYTQTATTTFSQDGRKLVIVGRYYVDDRNRIYASYSTTTLEIPTKESHVGEPHTFTHENIAIEDDIYVRVTTSSEVLKSQIKHDSNWRQFKAAEIPNDFKDIAIPGPLLDTLGIFSDSGVHLELVAQNIAISDARELYQYTFRLRSVPVDKGYLTVVGSRLYPEGVINVYINQNTKQVERISMKNAGFSNDVEIVIHHTPLSIASPTL